MKVQYFDRAGAPIDAARWRELMQQRAYRQLAFDEIGCVAVSTAWLGVAPQRNPRAVFETAVIAGAVLEERRYETEAEALAGHAAMCDELRATLGV